MKEKKDKLVTITEVHQFPNGDPTDIEFEVPLTGPVADLSGDGDNGQNTQLQTEVPTSAALQLSLPKAIYPVLDPVKKKRPRGRPKGSRHKSLAENGYKKDKPKER